MPKAVLLFVFSFFLGIHGINAQSKDFLLLKRGANQKSQIRYQVGENLTYKSKKLGYYVTDKILSFDKDYIYLTENILNPSDIESIDIRTKDPRNRTLKNLTALFLGSGVLLISVETINSLYQDEQFSIDSGVAKISGALIATGLALTPLRYKTFEQKGKNRIQIVLMRLD